MPTPASIARSWTGGMGTTSSTGIVRGAGALHPDSMTITRSNGPVGVQCGLRRASRSRRRDHGGGVVGRRDVQAAQVGAVPSPITLPLDPERAAIAQANDLPIAGLIRQDFFDLAEQEDAFGLAITGCGQAGHQAGRTLVWSLGQLDRRLGADGDPHLAHGAVPYRRITVELDKEPVVAGDLGACPVAAGAPSVGIRQHPFVVRIGLQGADAFGHGGQVALGWADIARGLACPRNRVCRAPTSRYL